MAGDSTTIARPYAEAAFAVAKQQGDLETWSTALGRLALICEDPQIAAQVGNPSVARERLRDLILGVAGDGLPREVQSLVALLSDNHRLPVLPDLARLFEELKTAEQGIRHVLVRSAFALSDAEQQDLAVRLKTYFGAEITLAVEEDEGLIGGVEIRADDIVIDGSIRGRLTQLANELHI